MSDTPGWSICPKEELKCRGQNVTNEIFALCVCLSVTETFSHPHKYRNKHTNTQTHKHTQFYIFSSHLLRQTHTFTHKQKSHRDKCNYKRANPKFLIAKVDRYVNIITANTSTQDFKYHIISTKIIILLVGCELSNVLSFQQ